MLPHGYRSDVQGIRCIQRPKPALSDDDARCIPDAETHHGGTNVLLHVPSWREAITPDIVSKATEGLTKHLLQDLVEHSCGSRAGK